VAALREEITEVLAANGGQWNKAAVSKLVRVDSAVRESMRISIFQSHGLYRLVVDPNGVTMHDGLHLPQGTKVGTSTYSIHHDDHIYENAHVYDALRFSRAREESADMLKAKNLSTVTTSDIFL
jgi:cytochrome P450